MCSTHNNMFNMIRNRLTSRQKDLIQYYYDRYCRAYLPKQDPVIYNGVVVDFTRKADILPITPRISSIEKPTEGLNHPSYESAIGRQLRNQVTKGDTVVIVGGGFGVTAVIAARQVGNQGRVLVYEGGYQEVNFVRRTARYNHLHDRIEVHHSIVHAAKKLRSSGDGANILRARDLPQCDVLELDCEGVESNIIQSMNINPQNIIVETHGNQGSPAEAVSKTLINEGYKIMSSEIAEDSKPEMCKKKDIHVITALSE